MLRHSVLQRRSRTVAGLGAGIVVASGLALVASPSAVAAPVDVTVQSHTVDFSESRAKGHHEFGPDGVRVYTDPSDGTDPNGSGGTWFANKAAGYFEAAAPLADAATTEPVLTWVDNPADESTARPGLQLRVDFDGDGNIDGTLVGEPVYGDDWWLTGGSEAFVKTGAPSTTSGSGSQWHGTLDQWSAAFEDAEIITSGWSLGSGIVGDGTITSISVGETTYTFEQSPAATAATLYENDVDLTQTRAKGSNEFLEDGGVRVTTLASDCQDPNPTTEDPADVWCANKAAGYFAVDVPLADAGEPVMSYTHTAGARPSVQLVTDFDGNGTPDGILVGETVYGRDWWVPGGAAQFVKDGAPSHVGGSGSDNHGLLSEWRAAFPDAVILQAGWSLGSGVEGSGVIDTITVGLKEFEFSGANRAPVVGDSSASGIAGRKVVAQLQATDADGDELTYASEAGTVDGSTLSFTVPADAARGTYQVPFTVTDGEDTTEGNLAVTVAKAPTSAKLAVTPQKITTKTKKVVLVATLSSTGAEGGQVFFFDGDRKLGKAPLRADGTARFVNKKPLARGQHALVVKYWGNPSTLATTKTVRKTVRRG
jgi:hypothetical protein